jgi:hypothetical protein
MCGRFTLSGQRRRVTVQAPKSFFFGPTDPNLPSFEIDPDLAFGLFHHVGFGLMVGLARINGPWGD